MILTLLHPGEMGSSIGACARQRGHEVRWVTAGRSPATAQRAATAGLTPAATLGDALAGSDAVISVCPPAAAQAVAQAVRATGYDRFYVEANAIAPDTSRQISAALLDLDFVDGGIVGPPAWGPGRTRLFLSGPRAAAVADWFAGSDLECVVVGAEAGLASALKVCYAGWTKGSAALLLAVRALAEHHGVADALLAEWQRSQPGLEQRAAATAAGSGPKAWRWVAEMEEIAATFRAAELPDEFHRGAARLFQDLAGFRDAPAPDLPEVLTALQARCPNPGHGTADD